MTSMANVVSKDASRVSANGWRQGSVLSQSLVTTLIQDHQIPGIILPRAECKSGGWLGRCCTALKQAFRRSTLAKSIDVSTERWMVISQDCDIVQLDWSKEPYVELVRIRIAQGNELPPPWGQSPRDIQFSDPHGDKHANKFVCSVHSRVWIDRRYLEDSCPDHERAISRESVRRLCHWISRRYVRAAFPDEFNRRTKAALDQLAEKKSALSRGSDLLKGVYMLVSETELDQGATYRIKVWAAMKPSEYEDQQKNNEAQELVNLLESALSGCSGIDIEECVLKSEQDITLDHLHIWKRWDFDILSLRPKNKSDKLPSIEDLPPTI
jgi:hypothetical protein